jgi:threonine aldolase
MKILDFRSDTVTRPSSEMRQVMATAEVGDDVLGDDPNVIALEKEVGELFGGEAMYVPSGTMGNQIAIKSQTEPGEELICERYCHIVNYELGGPAFHSGLLINFQDTEKGMISSEQVRKSIRPPGVYNPRTAMVALENTHNRHSGSVLPQDEILEVAKVCKSHGVLMHLDGARIWHAHIKTGLSLKELTAPFDSMSVCFSKGLGAPVGSAIISSPKVIAKARRYRRLFGGGMRQAGILAAAARYALKNNLSRLADDHANAKVLAEGLVTSGLFDIPLERIETNIIVAKVRQPHTVESLLEKLKTVGIWALPFGAEWIRFVTHLDISREDCHDAISRLRTI